MRILLYEYFTGGGLWTETAETQLRHALLVEGRAMVDTLGEDLRRIAGVELVQFRDSRLLSTPACAGAPNRLVSIPSAQQERAELAAWCCRVDGVILIAPESDGRLWERARWVEEQGGRLLSADSTFVALTTDKSRTAEHLARSQVAVPRGQQLAGHEAIPEEFPFPAVLKPNDGVGSSDTYRVLDRQQAMRLRQTCPRAMRLEAYCPGTPVSVLALSGPRRMVFLPACHQRVTCDGEFHYRGGAFPIAGPLRQRAGRLARATLAALPRTNGFVGVDMVLGDEPNGAGDVVLEVNPRLTTSYVGLRHATSSNLAAAMLAAQRGRPYPLFFHPQAVEFDADGHICTSDLSVSVTR